VTTSILLALLILNIFIKKNFYLKYISIIFLIAIFLLSFSIVQKTIIESYLHEDKKQLNNQTNYSIIVLGGNHVKRLYGACEIISNLNIENILIIRDDKRLVVGKDNFGCLEDINLIENKIQPKSTLDDINIIKNNLKYLNQKIILITDDFHIPRTKILLRNYENRLYYYPVRNLRKMNYDNVLDLNHGIRLFNILVKEYMAILYYYIFNKIN
tara:strand:- start:3006 stop:3644 length:639 start_codon:yes stop_codon:yes gene_type:complete